ncbi:MAG: hypothetical protein GF383_16100 [Candidatus Lokiarchaeota archaeon]|nr:hypothetical protein [Candidatus Lokiarchaeota archaeon]MBD3343254.1 hypothetical protein [Candidatus Lokiarchaeota archaeon]
MHKVIIQRSSPSYEELIELFKNEKDKGLKEKYHALFLMHIFKNCAAVAGFLKKPEFMIERWVKDYNNGGVRALSPEIFPKEISIETRAQL